MEDWGAWVRWCRLWGRDFCVFCLVVNRAWHQLILHRSPTFIGFNPRGEIPEDKQ
jgi:hypothetical protein